MPAVKVSSIAKEGTILKRSVRRTRWLHASFEMTCITDRFEDRGDRKFVYVLTSRASEIHVSHGLLANLRVDVQSFTCDFHVARHLPRANQFSSSPYRETAGMVLAREFLPPIDSNFTNICFPAADTVLQPLSFPWSLQFPYVAACVSGEEEKKKENWKLSWRYQSSFWIRKRSGFEIHSRDGVIFSPWYFNFSANFGEISRPQLSVRSPIKFFSSNPVSFEDLVQKKCFFFFFFFF